MAAIDPRVKPKLLPEPVLGGSRAGGQARSSFEEGIAGGSNATTYDRKVW